MMRTAISVTHASKAYRIWNSPSARFKSILLHLLKHTVPPLWDVCSRMQARCFRDFYALKDVSFEVRRGEALGIVGRNGSGKSTLLQIVAGTLAPSHGTVDVYGRVAALLELGSGFNPEFSGRENVLLNASILGLSDNEIRARFDEIASFADIGDFLDQPVKTYSSGMAVRLAFAVVAHIDADVLIIDEALAVGDAVFQAKCYRRFREMREAGATVILVTHDIGAVVQTCDRALVLDHGSIVATGTPKEMADEYRRRCASDIAPFNVSEATQPLGHEDSGRWSARLPDTQEYGDGAAVIERFSLSDAGGLVDLKVSSGSRLCLRVQIRFARACVDPIVGFGFRDSRGVDICGTNTWYEGKPIGLVQPGDMVEVNFGFVLPLQSDVYCLCLACTELQQTGLAVHHRLYDVSVVEVSATRRFVGRWDLNPLVSVENRSAFAYRT